MTNRLGMKMMSLPAGQFLMGSRPGYGKDFDEFPQHKVIISEPFYMSATEVTNAQYEKFDPAHKKKRGIKGLSKEDNEAVVNVSWHEAVAFCEWLSKKEGKPYRLPTEAEWEYACRAGTKTAFHTGNKLPEAINKKQTKPRQATWDPMPVSTKVMSIPANAWGLYDMHGNVEEWCSDWYGPYVKQTQKDPVGRLAGHFKVTRGGSHNTQVRYLRSAKRLGTLPEDKHWLIGFRVVIGKVPQTKPLPAVVRPEMDGTVEQKQWDWKKSAPDPNKPYFYAVRTFVKIPFKNGYVVPGKKGKEVQGPLYSRHNHQPAITYCSNGDLLAIWYSCTSEASRHMSMAMSRLRAGKTEWDEATLFWDPPARNPHGCALWTDEKGKIFHFNGLNTRGTWANLAMIMRTSTDNGKTWSKERIIFDHGTQNQVLRGVIKTSKGKLIVLGDAGINSIKGRSEPGTALHISDDNGETWYNPTENMSKAELARTGKSSRGRIMYGLHGSIVELKDGSLMGLTRSSRIQNKMAKSISRDNGKTWTYSPSGLQVVGSAQRNAFIRLREGPLFYAGFANLWIPVKDKKGKVSRGLGLFAALSYDEGKTWKVRKLVTDGKPAHEMDGHGNTHKFIMSPSTAERGGYLDCVQTPDKVIHLISSGLHYSFNMKWVETPWGKN